MQFSDQLAPVSPTQIDRKVKLLTEVTKSADFASKAVIMRKFAPGEYFGHVDSTGYLLGPDTKRFFLTFTFPYGPDTK